MAFLSYSTTSTGLGTEDDKNRIFFTTTFSGVRPDLAFSQRANELDPDYDYGPIVVLVKQMDITLNSGVEIRSELKSFSINGINMNLDKTCDVYKLDEETLGEDYSTSTADIWRDRWRIVHTAPPLVGERTAGSTGVAGVDYLDLTNLDGSLKYFLFDPMEILVRAYYSDDTIDDLSDAQVANLQSEKRKLNVETRYGITDFEWNEIEPVRFYDYWLRERLQYLFVSYYKTDQAGEITSLDKGHYWPSPFEIYQRHKPENSIIPVYEKDNYDEISSGLLLSLDTSSVDNDLDKKSGPLMQELRWAYYYTLAKQEGFDAKDLSSHFATNFQKNDPILNVLAWDGVPVELGLTKNEKLGYKPPKAKHVRLITKKKQASICYGCNRHPGWIHDYEHGCQMDNYEAEACNNPMTADDIPKIGPTVTVAETEQLPINKFTTVMERAMFDRFYVLSIGIDNSTIHTGGQCWKNPPVSGYTTGSVRVVPELSNLTDIIRSEHLFGHTEICARLVKLIELINADQTSEIDGYMLSNLQFGISNDGLSSSTRYPYEFRSEKSLKDQMREITNNLDWSELNMIKVGVNRPSAVPGKIVTKRAYKSLDRISVAEIYIVEEIFSGGGGGGTMPEVNDIACPTPSPPMRAGGSSPATSCCPTIPWVSPVTGNQNDPEADMRCACHTMDGYNTGGGGSVQRIHAFGCFLSYPIPEWYEDMPAWYHHQTGFGWVEMDMQRRAKSVASLYLGTVIDGIQIKSPTSKCLPGMVGPGWTDTKLVFRRDNVPMVEYEQDEIIEIFESVADPAINFNPGSGQCAFTAPEAIYSPYGVVYTYGQKTYSTAGPALTIDPMGWSHASRDPYRFHYLGFIGFCCSENPGSVMGWRKSESPGHYYGTKSGGRIFLNAYTRGRYLWTGASTWPGAQFDYSYWCTHHFKIRDGIYEACRCN